MAENDWTRVLGWPGYKVYRHEIDEAGKRLKLWVRGKRGNKYPVCSGCSRPVDAIAASYEREVRDLPWSEYRTTVVIELYRVHCPDCGVKAEKVPLLPSKAPFVYDKFHILQHAGAAVDEVRRQEFFRKGGSAREMVKGKRWLLLTRWVHLTTNKKRQLNALFALNRRLLKAYLLKAYLLKESLDRLWNYRYEGAMTRYLNSWIDQLRWQRLKPMEKLADMLISHLDGILNYCRTRVRMAVVEAVNGNIKALLRRRRGYRNLNYLLLKAQRLAATRTQLVAFQKAA